MNENREILQQLHRDYLAQANAALSEADKLTAVVSERANVQYAALMARAQAMLDAARMLEGIMRQVSGSWS